MGVQNRHAFTAPSILTQNKPNSVYVDQQKEVCAPYQQKWNGARPVKNWLTALYTKQIG